MLEKFLQKSRGFVLAAIVLLLSGVFILQFGGPQAQGCTGSSTVAPAAQVYGEAISGADLRAAFILLGGDRYPAELAKQYKLKDMVLYGLVEESLLAREAKRLGFTLNEDDVMEQVIEDGLVYVPMSVEAGPYLPPAGPRRYDFNDKDGKFSKDNLKRFIQGGLQRSVRDFTESQIRASLAQRMREVILASAEVAPGEVWDAFVREKEKATIEYARFAPSYFESKLNPSEEELAAFMTEQATAVDEAYEKQKHRYTGLEKQVRARHILVKVDSEATPEVKEEARARAQALLARARAGVDFAELARTESGDTGSAKKGGDLGYNAKGRMVKPFDDAQFSLPVGAISDLVESNFGFHIIKVEGIREGDVPVEEARREVADKLYREQKSKALAKEAADAALAQLKSGASSEEIAKTLPGAVAEGESADPLAPQFRSSSPFGRTETPIAGPFDGGAVTDAAFALELTAPVPEQPLALGNELVVFKLTDKKLATREAFTEEEQARLRMGLLEGKRRQALANYVRELLHKAQVESAILVDQSQLTSTESQS